MASTSSFKELEKIFAKAEEIKNEIGAKRDQLRNLFGDISAILDSLEEFEESFDDMKRNMDDAVANLSKYL
jgi:uncharacterized protein YoxC